LLRFKVAGITIKGGDVSSLQFKSHKHGAQTNDCWQFRSSSENP